MWGILEGNTAFLRNVRLFFRGEYGIIRLGVLLFFIHRAREGGKQGVVNPSRARGVYWGFEAL